MSLGGLTPSCCLRWLSTASPAPPDNWHSICFQPPCHESGPSLCSFILPCQQPFAKAKTRSRAPRCDWHWVEWEARLRFGHVARWFYLCFFVCLLLFPSLFHSGGCKLYFYKQTTHQNKKKKQNTQKKGKEGVEEAVTFGNVLKAV